MPASVRWRRGRVRAQRVGWVRPSSRPRLEPVPAAVEPAAVEPGPEAGPSRAARGTSAGRAARPAATTPALRAAALPPEASRREQRAQARKRAAPGEVAPAEVGPAAAPGWRRGTTKARPAPRALRSSGRPTPAPLRPTPALPRAERRVLRLPAHPMRGRACPNLPRAEQMGWGPRSPVPRTVQQGRSRRAQGPARSAPVAPGAWALPTSALVAERRGQARAPGNPT